MRTRLPRKLLWQWRRLCALLLDSVGHIFILTLRALLLHSVGQNKKHDNNHHLHPRRHHRHRHYHRRHHRHNTRWFKARGDCLRMRAHVFDSRAIRRQPAKRGAMEDGDPIAIISRCPMQPQGKNGPRKVWYTAMAKSPHGVQVQLPSHPPDAQATSQGVQCGMGPGATASAEVKGEVGNDDVAEALGWMLPHASTSEERSSASLA